MSDDVREEEFSIHWIQDVVDSVQERDATEYLISTGKSPSASIHIGIMRELIISDVIKRELHNRGKPARTMFVVDDYDPIRSFPKSISLSIDEWAGIPYSDIPDEFGCCESFGAHWAKELVDTFPDFGIDHEVVYTSTLYENPEMIDAVRICLRKTETIRKIMIEFVGSGFGEEQRKQYAESMKTWYPASVICSECGRLQAGTKGEITPNRVTDYNAEDDLVSYTCQHCGHSETVPLDSVRVKLVWRVDWPAKWYVLGVTCEPAGKDHSVKGGSYDTGLEISKKVFGWAGPVKVPYEWVRIGGRDMSTSGGIVFIPRTWESIAPPELYRFIMIRTNLSRGYDIHPEMLPDMIDGYERFERVFYGLEDADESQRELAKIIYPLTTAEPPSEEYQPKLPFKFAVVTSQLEDVLGREAVLARSEEVLKKLSGLDIVTPKMQSMIEKRLWRARNWVTEFGPARERISIPETVPDDIKSTFTDQDRQFLAKLVDVLRSTEMDDDELQAAVFDAARSVELKERRAFVVLYRILISTKSGPRLAPFINTLGRGWVADRIASVL